MHEMSVAQHILDLVRRNLNGANEKDVRSIRLRIGSAAGILTDSLEFCFHVLVADSSFRQSSLLIEQTPLTLQCQPCGSLRTSDAFVFLCPACGSSHVTVLSGTELELVDIEIADAVEKSA